LNACRIKRESSDLVSLLGFCLNVPTTNILSRNVWYVIHEDGKCKLTVRAFFSLW